MYYLNSSFEGPYIIKTSSQSLVFSGEASDCYTIKEDVMGKLIEEGLIVEKESLSGVD